MISSDLESQFAKLESGSDIDDELARIKESLNPSLAPAPGQRLLNPEQPTSTAKATQPVDADLEELKRQLDKL